MERDSIKPGDLKHPHKPSLRIEADVFGGVEVLPVQRQGEESLNGRVRIGRRQNQPTRGGKRLSASPKKIDGAFKVFEQLSGNDGVKLTLLDQVVEILRASHQESAVVRRQITGCCVQANHARIGQERIRHLRGAEVKYRLAIPCKHCHSLQSQGFIDFHRYVVVRNSCVARKLHRATGRGLGSPGPAFILPYGGSQQARFLLQTRRHPRTRQASEGALAPLPVGFSTEATEALTPTLPCRES